MAFTATDKLKCVERELRYRRRVYPRQIQLGKMSWLEAQEQLGLMQEIVDDYRSLAGAEELPLFITRTVGS